MFISISKLAVFLLPLGALAAPLVARQTADAAAQLDAERLKVVDGLRTANSTLTTVLGLVNNNNPADKAIFNSAGSALDDITKAGAAATRIAADINAGKAPSDADQGQVTVAILAAEKDVQALQRANGPKFKGGPGKKLKGPQALKAAKDKDRDLKAAIDGAAGGVAEAKGAGLQILALQGKKLDDVIKAAGGQ